MLFREWSEADFPKLQVLILMSPLAQAATDCVAAQYIFFSCHFFFLSFRPAGEIWLALRIARFLLKSK